MYPPSIICPGSMPVYLMKPMQSPICLSRRATSQPFCPFLNVQKKGWSMCRASQQWSQCSLLQVLSPKKSIPPHFYHKSLLWQIWAYEFKYSVSHYKDPSCRRPPFSLFPPWFLIAEIDDRTRSHSRAVLSYHFRDSDRWIAKKSSECASLSCFLNIYASPNCDSLVDSAFREQPQAGTLEVGAWDIPPKSQQFRDNTNETLTFTRSAKTNTTPSKSLFHYLFRWTKSFCYVVGMILQHRIYFTILNRSGYDFSGAHRLVVDFRFPYR